MIILIINVDVELTTSNDQTHLKGHHTHASNTVCMQPALINGVACTFDPYPGYYCSVAMKDRFVLF
jgi:hypothetical protein